jgi:hypothetical protein
VSCRSWFKRAGPVEFKLVETSTLEGLLHVGNNHHVAGKDMCVGHVPLVPGVRYSEVVGSYVFSSRKGNNVRFCKSRLEFRKSDRFPHFSTTGSGRILKILEVLTGRSRTLQAILAGSLQAMLAGRSDRCTTVVLLQGTRDTLVPGHPWECIQDVDKLLDPSVHPDDTLYSVELSGS